MRGRRGLSHRLDTHCDAFSHTMLLSIVLFQAIASWFFTRWSRAEHLPHYATPPSRIWFPIRGGGARKPEARPVTWTCVQKVLRRQSDMHASAAMHCERTCSSSIASTSKLFFSTLCH
jgi:hypothetical protein